MTDKQDPLDRPATAQEIDRCFGKLNTEYDAQNFSHEDGIEMYKQKHEKFKAILDIEQKAEPTARDLVTYFELHMGLWRSYKAAKNSLSSRYKRNISEKG